MQVIHIFICITKLKIVIQMELKYYQKTLLESLHRNKLSLVKHSRQMGITSVLVEYATELLLDNKHEHIIVLISYNTSSAKELLNRIRLDNRLSSLTKIKDGLLRLDLENGNSIRICSSLDGLRGYSFTNIIIDNACFIERLEDYITLITPSIMSRNLGSLVIASSNKKGAPFFNNLFYDDKNNFIKHKIHWSIDKERLKIYEDYKTILDDETFRCEIDLEDVSILKKNKDKLLSFRLNTDLYYKLTEKLITLDLSLSEYIRELIKKDN